MKRILEVATFIAVVAGIAAAAPACLTIEEAAKKVGQTVCVTGKVVKVAESRAGNVYLDFCRNYKDCPFTVFVPASSARDLGNLRKLEGKVIEVDGKIELYRGRAEIILKDRKQLREISSKRTPKEFDAARKEGRVKQPRLGTKPPSWSYDSNLPQPAWRK